MTECIIYARVCDLAWLGLGYVSMLTSVCSSDVLEDMRVNVHPEGTDKVLWYKASYVGVGVRWWS